MNKDIRSRIQSFLQKDPVILTAAILFLCVVVYGRFLFGDDYFIWRDLGSDTINSYWPAYTYFSDTLKEGLELYSLELALGSNLFSGSLLFFDPFIWLYAFTDIYGIARLVMVVFILKILIGALCFQQFLRYFVHSRYLIFLFALLYAFNGFSVVWGQHYYFGTLVMVFPMILWGIERALHGESFILLSLAVALGLISSYYFMYMAAFFLAVYLLARLFFLYGLDWKAISSKAFFLGGGFALGVGLSALILLPTIAATFSTSRVSGQFANFPILSLPNRRTLLTIAASLFSNGLFGTTGNYIGIGNYYDSPHLYSGLLPLLALPHILFSKNSREKLFVLILLLFSAVTLALPFAAVVLNGFSALSYRWTYFVIVFLLLSAAISAQSMIAEGKRRPGFLMLWLFLYTCAALILSWAAVRYRYSERGLNFNAARLLLTDGASQLFPILLLLAAYSLLAHSFFRWKYSRPALLVLIAIELLWNTTASLWARTPLSESDIRNKQAYFDHSYTIIRSVEAEDPGLYRFDKSFLSQFWNDGLIQGYRNYHAYWSILPTTTFTFFEEIGGGTAINLQLGFIPSDVIRSLLSVKYYLVKNVEEVPRDYEQIGKSGDVYLFRNNHWVPMGSVYHRFITQSAFEAIDVPNRDRMMAMACVIPDELAAKAAQLGLVELRASDLPSELEDWDSYEDLRKLSSTSLKLVTSRDDFIQGSISTQSAGIMFFPITNDPGWEISVNGQQTRSIDANLGLLGLFIEPGVQEVSLRYIPPLLREGAMVSGASLIIFFCAQCISLAEVAKQPKLKKNKI